MKQNDRSPLPDPFQEQAAQATALVFDLLESRSRGRFLDAANAQIALRRLGIDLRFQRPTTSTPSTRANTEVPHGGS